MKLQELLNRATERPWEVGPCPCGSPVCTKFVLTKPLNVDGRLTKSDALLQRHAVNHLEPLLVALSGITAALRPILESGTPLNVEFIKSAVAIHVKIAEAVIHKAEEVTLWARQKK